MAPAKKPVPAPTAGVSFGDLSMYVAGGGMPEGDYSMKDLTVQMYQAQNQQGVSKGPARLGVMVTFAPLDGGEERKQFYSMGSNADKSFAPAPSGKGLIAVPGGPGTTLNESTNWAIFLKSMYDSGLPNGIFDGDCSVLDGTHVHIANVPEPEERKQYRGSQTGEAAADQQSQGPKTIAVVTEIKDDGKPWEGTGGEIATKAAGKPNGKPAQPAQAEEPAADEDQDVMVHAINAISSMLEDPKHRNGLPKLMLRTGTFKALSKTPDVANAVMEKVFKTDASLNALLDQLGYKLKGTQVVVA